MSVWSAVVITGFPQFTLFTRSKSTYDVIDVPVMVAVTLNGWVPASLLSVVYIVTMLLAVSKLVIKALYTEEYGESD